MQEASFPCSVAKYNRFGFSIYSINGFWLSASIASFVPRTIPYPPDNQVTDACSKPSGSSRRESVFPIPLSVRLFSVSPFCSAVPAYRTMASHCLVRLSNPTSSSSDFSNSSDVALKARFNCESNT